LEIDFLGVASLEEGITLRKSNIKCPVLILGPVFKEHIKPIIKFNLRQTVFSYDVALALDREAARFKRKAIIHVKVDTGMGRLGVLVEDALDLILKISRLRHVVIEGLFTHFPMAEANPQFTRHQIDIFNNLVNLAVKKGVKIPLIHAANSAGLIGYKNSHFNLVRPGLMIYGISPKNNLKFKLKPVLSLITRVMSVKNLPYGYGVSYGHTFITNKPTKIAVIPIGYGDGYFRILSNKAHVLIRGKMCKIIGNICMDQMMVDVSKVKGVKVKDEVVLIGRQKDKVISAEYLADLARTIPYEIVCNIGGRIPRVYTFRG
jgi:alanine racemase